jgi:hypothetical protein
MLEDGTTRRRTSTHVKFSLESPVMFDYDEPDRRQLAAAANQATLPSTSSQQHAATPADTSTRQQQPVSAPTCSTSMPDAIRTRSGRAIGPLSSLDDFVEII